MQTKESLSVCLYLSINIGINKGINGVAFFLSLGLFLYAAQLLSVTSFLSGENILLVLEGGKYGKKLWGKKHTHSEILFSC